MNTTNKLITTTLSRLQLLPEKRRSAFHQGRLAGANRADCGHRDPALAGAIRLSGLAQRHRHSRRTMHTLRYAPAGWCSTSWAALPFCILGAFQFGPRISPPWPRWHRLPAAVGPMRLTPGPFGLWNESVLSLLQTGLLYSFGCCWLGLWSFAVLGLVAILRRDIANTAPG